MRAYVPALVLASFVLTACGPDYDCGTFVYSPSEERCVCPIGYIENEDFTSCISLDAGMPPDGGMPDDAAGPSDSGIEVDSGPPLVPECTTSADCGAGDLVQCVAQRCVFCAVPSSAPEEVRSGTGLRSHLALGVRHRTVEPAIGVVATLGDTTSEQSRLHAFELDSPSHGFVEDLDAVVRDVCADDSAVMTSVAFGAPGPDSMTVQVLVDGPAAGARITYLDWRGTRPGQLTPGGYVCRPSISGAPREILPTGTIVTNAEAGSVIEVVGVHREREPDGDVALVPTGTGYANELTSLGRHVDGVPLPGDPLVRMHSAGHFAYLSDPAGTSFVMWSPTGVTGGARISTPDRTGEVALVHLATDSVERYLAAYPVADRVRFVNLECDSSCRSTGKSIDLRTGADIVQRVSLALAGSVPVMLTAEEVADGTTRLVLRVLRSNLTPFDAPGGGREAVFDVLPVGSVYDDSQLAVLSGTTTRYVTAWMRSEAEEASVRVQSFTATCGAL